MTMNQNHDRTYWRAQTDRTLIDAARYNPTIELCIALGERLEDSDGIDAALADAHAELIELNARCDALRAEVEELHAALTAIE